MRRTKDASEQTRRQILAAARAEFAQRGVTRTTLEHIARAAGVTRGAIYWHFANKSELFRAMRDQVTLPLVDRTDFALLEPPDGEPLEAIERFMRQLADMILNDRECRETFEILNLKCEYVDELRDELRSQGKRCSELLATLTLRYEEAARSGALRPGLTAEVAALESGAFLVGLFRLALICGSKAHVGARAYELIAAHMAGRRRAVPARSPARARQHN